MDKGILTITQELKEKCKWCNKFMKVEYDIDNVNKTTHQVKNISKFMARYGLESWTRDEITRKDEQTIKYLIFSS